MTSRALIPVAATYPAAATGGRMVALLVGVNIYDSMPRLAYAVNDAAELADVLRSPACGFDEVVLLTTGGATEPTAANVRHALCQVLAGRQKEDIVLVALAGHGVQVEVSGPNGEDARLFPFFCPQDADLKTVKYPDGTSDTMLNLDRLLGHLGDCPAGVKLVLVDACREEMKATGRTRSLEKVIVSVPHGVQALLSCGRGQVAHEIDALKHGLFFYHVINGLKGKARDDKGAVTWTSLAGYVLREVTLGARDLRGRHQSPATLGSHEGEPPVMAPAGEAEYRLGIDYLMAWGVPFDSKRAAECFKQASDAGHPLARGTHALDLLLGGEVVKDEAEARRLVATCLRDIEEVAKWSPGAMYLLGRLNFEGLGVEKDEAKGVRLLRLAADRGERPAMNSLGTLYEQGRGVEQDDRAAAGWFRLAAAEGEPRAMFNLGVMYEQGRGVEKDDAEAAGWYRMATEKGHAGAKAALERLGVKD